MTKETAKALLPIIIAFAQDKTIQYKRKLDGIGNWKDCDDIDDNESNYYRIKPHNKIVPFTFEDAKDIIGKTVKYKNIAFYGLITAVNNEAVRISERDIYFHQLLSDCIFAETGFPCGKEVEE